jgi:hypothetical protein
MLMSGSSPNAIMMVALLPLVLVVPVSVTGLIFATEEDPALAAAGFLGVPVGLWAYSLALEAVLTYAPSASVLFLILGLAAFGLALMPGRAEHAPAATPARASAH